MQAQQNRAWEFDLEEGTLDAGKLATELGVKNLLLYHTEDKNIARRKELYTAEGRQYFHGNLFVPEDLEVIEL